MRIKTPLYIEAQPGGFQVRPLFLSDPRERAARLESALARQALSLRQEMSRRAQASDHHWLRRLAYNPPLKEQVLNLEFEHRKRTGRCRRLVVILQSPQRALFFPGLSAEIALWPKGVSLRQRAEEVLKELLKQKKLEPEQASLQGRAWISELELEQPLDFDFDAEEDNLAILGGPQLSRPSDELEKVGRCLDDLYPGELLPCLGRQPEVARAQAWLQRCNRSALLVMGEPRVGKTALIHELVRQTKLEPGAEQRRFWQLSASRLISGMSYQGQWERRFLCILEYAQENDLVLYFDDLLALGQAGKSRHCDLCLADLLKPALERGLVRVLTETTCQGWGLVQERDPSLTALLSPLRLEATDQEQTLQIVLDHVQKLELERQLHFSPTAIPELMTLCTRHRPTEQFPGKAIDFIGRLSGTRNQVEPHHLTLQVANETGMSLELLDDTKPIDIEKLRNSINAEMVSQPTAVEILLETICLAKARLCDPTRPLATLLFAGPTGVGKDLLCQAVSETPFRNARSFTAIRHERVPRPLGWSTTHRQPQPTSRPIDPGDTSSSPLRVAARRNREGPPRRIPSLTAAHGGRTPDRRRRADRRL